VAQGGHYAWIFQLNRWKGIAGGLTFDKQGFEVIPYKIDFKASRNNKVTIIDFLPSVDI
jgi:hypothetical protein